MSFACFVFCCCPRMRFAKVFNAFLPLFFDRMFRYSILLLPSVIIVAFAILLSSAWYFFGQAYLGFGGEAAGSFIFYVILNLTVYSVLPIAWRKIHNNKLCIQLWLFAHLLQCHLLFSGWPYLIRFTEYLPCSVFIPSYIVGMLILARSEKNEVNG